jgi:hypothetical protein
MPSKDAAGTEVTTTDRLLNGGRGDAGRQPGVISAARADYRALIISSLLSIGIEPNLVAEIETGAEIYGPTGVLDSVYLVALIAAIEEAFARALDRPVNVFGERGVDLLDEFRDADTLGSFLERNARATPRPANRRGEVTNDRERTAL